MGALTSGSTPLRRGRWLKSRCKNPGVGKVGEVEFCMGYLYAYLITRLDARSFTLVNNPAFHAPYALRSER
jgi:hypothetical protein